MNVQCKFPQYSSRTRATTSPKDQKCGPFRVIGRRKKHANDRTRPVSTRDGPLDQPIEQTVYMGQPRAVFSRVGPFKANFEHHTGRRGADRCFEEGRVDVNSALVRHTGAHLQPETNGNTPQPIVRTRDLQRLYSPRGADERAERRTVSAIAVEVDANRWTKLHCSAIKSH